jgi:hypothetical protein
MRAFANVPTLPVWSLVAVLPTLAQIDKRPS